MKSLCCIFVSNIQIQQYIIMLKLHMNCLLEHVPSYINNVTTNQAVQRSLKCIVCEKIQIYWIFFVNRIPTTSIKQSISEKEIWVFIEGNIGIQSQTSCKETLGPFMAP